MKASHFRVSQNDSSGWYWFIAFTHLNTLKVAALTVASHAATSKPFTNILTLFYKIRTLFKLFEVQLSSFFFLLLTWNDLYEIGAIVFASRWDTRALAQAGVILVLCSRWDCAHLSLVTVVLIIIVRELLVQLFSYSVKVIYLRW